MPSLRRASSAFLVALAVVGAARAGGVAVLDGAVIEAGEGAPSGVARVDADAGPKTPPVVPAVPALDEPAAMTGEIPNFVAGGVPTTPFHATSDLTFPGGTYDYVDYAVDVGVTVTYTGPVVIRTTSFVQIDGLVTSTASGASIAFVVGGDFKIVASPYGSVEGVYAAGAAAPVSIDVAGVIETTTADESRMQIRSAARDVLVTAHGAGREVLLDRVDVRGGAGAVVRAAGSVTATDAVVSVLSGDALVQAFGGAVALSSSTLVTFDGDVFVEGAKGVAVTDDSDLHAEGTLSISGFGDPEAPDGAEDVVIDASNVSVFTPGAPSVGDLRILSSAGVRVADTSVMTHDGQGDMVLTSFGADVVLETPGATGETEIAHYGTGGVLVAAKRDVDLFGLSRIDAAAGRIDLRASEGTVAVSGGCALTADVGPGALRAGAAVVSAPDAASGPDAPRFTAKSWTVTAGDGGIDLDTCTLTASAGAASLLAGGPIRVHGACTSSAALTVQSTAAGLDLVGASLSTTSVVAGASAPIVVESYSGVGTIDAANATIKSGDAAAGKSGNVTVSVFSLPPPVVNSFIVATSVAVKIDKKDKTKSVLTAAGWLDTGADLADLVGDATVTVGDLVVPVKLVWDKKNVKLVHTDAALTFAVVPPKDDRSKAAFSLKRTGDLSGVVDAAGAGPLLLRFQKDGIDAAGRVSIEAFKYALAKRRGALVLPTLLVYKAAAVVKGGGADSLSLVAGLAANGPAPTTAPQVIVGFGAWTATIPSAAFAAPKPGVAAKRDYFTAKNPLPGIASLTLDYVTEKLTLVVKKTDLGAFPTDASQPVAVSVQIGTDLRTVHLRMARKKTTVSY